MHPDGMSPDFYEKYWHIIVTDIINLVKQFFSTNNFDSFIKDINIVLIPKKQDPTSMTELRPIS